MSQKKDDELKTLIDITSNTLYAVETLISDPKKREKYVQDIEELRKKWFEENGLNEG